MQAGTTATFDLALTKRQLVKLVEKHLGPSAEQIALAIKALTTNNDFMKAAMKTKSILHNIKPASINDPLWGVIGI